MSLWAASAAFFLCFAFYPSFCEGQTAQSPDFLSALNKPSVVIFYSSDCAPCHAELKRLPQLQKAAKNWSLVLATLTKPDAALLKKTADLAIKVIDLSTSNGSLILKSLNDDQLMLPFAFATDRSGALCARQSGLLGTDKIKGWRHLCSL